MTVTTKLSVQQVQAEAQRFGLTREQIDRFTFQAFESSTLVVVYPGHADTAGMTTFLERLVSAGKASRRD
jgi:hypothetical protein